MHIKRILPENNSYTPSIKLHTFRWLLGFAIFCFALIWTIDELSGLISPFDEVSYPFCIFFFILIYFVSLKRSINREYLFLFTYFIVAGYLTSSSIYHHITLHGTFSNASQWLGLNYVMAYLFLDVRKAAFTSIVVFIMTMVGHYVVLMAQFNVSDALGVLLNIGVSHLVYMVLLWTVLRMRIQSAKIQERLEMLEHYALLDPLTQVFNRRGLEDELFQAELAYQQQSQSYAILLVDIDHFKLINDRHGHLIGDWVLTEFIAVLNKTTSPEDKLGRWGGEEFVILKQDASHQETFDCAERIRIAVSERIQVVEGEMLSVSIGIGYSGEAEDSRGVLGIADRNLYTAKNTGRNCVMDTASAATVKATKIS
ncbi:putative diguanylate cyclase YcdT [Vibrio aerogenes CECT 7868]|uniref:diguanylate cyclase n=1 Tax=Vibrio aerogenes CECT 7868 TaxID=1216006 RepID=A0A1M6C576_9VIBR|nr:GGDEF domain-containing protein [Vibrio aerogenes]SHI56169.1 putative diguanylate cyclase YcdT [Vibrio aerogenes CECT 7868]